MTQERPAYPDYYDREVKMSLALEKKVEQAMKEKGYLDDLDGFEKDMFDRFGKEHACDLLTGMHSWTLIDIVYLELLLDTHLITI